MDMNKLTQKSQEAVQQAQAIALRYGHQEVDGEHLLAALVAQEDGLVPRILVRMQVDGDVLKSEVEKELARQPKISGPGVEQDKIYVTQRFQKLFLSAQGEAERLKDEYISVEHLLLALIGEGDKTPAGRILKQFNITRDNFLSVLTQIRGNQSVTSANPEMAYEALEKYGIDLVAEARAGIKDPRRPIGSFIFLGP
ncbi:MAG: type VI secretion system ATPase TssH, partial [Gemmatimonadota bacterium]|nr:type VI secretion system ATPase TssH [Gemmatimonadota bacterium]